MPEDRHSPGRLRRLRDALDAVLLGDARSGAFRSEAGGMQMGEAAAYLVNGVGVEDVSPGCDHLVRPGGLLALVEGAAIRYAAEDAGNEDGIVGIAEATEDLILVAGIVVTAHIKLVAMLIQRRTVAEGIESGIGRGEQVQDIDRVLIDTV